MELSTIVSVDVSCFIAVVLSALALIVFADMLIGSSLVNNTGREELSAFFSYLVVSSVVLKFAC